MFLNHGNAEPTADCPPYPRAATAAALAEVKPLREQLGAAQGARAGEH